MDKAIERLKSWPTWIAFGALVVFVVLQVTGVDISTPVNTLLTLFLPVLVAFGIINDPATHKELFAHGEQEWWQSKPVWAALFALVAYVVRLVFNIDLTPFFNGFFDALLPLLMALGIVTSPTRAG